MRLPERDDRLIAHAGESSHEAVAVGQRDQRRRRDRRGAASVKIDPDEFSHRELFSLRSADGDFLGGDRGERADDGSPPPVSQMCCYRLAVVIGRGRVRRDQ